MAKVLKNVSIIVNSVEMGRSIREVTVHTERDQVEVTAFQAANKEYLPGLGDASMEFDCLVDYGAASLDAQFWPLSTTDTPFPVVVKPNLGVASPSNPAYTMQGLMYEYDPIAGAVGEAATTTVTIQNADQAGLVRTTA